MQVTDDNMENNGAPADAAETAPADATPQADETARLQAELAATNERLLRLAAEFQNYRRRTEAEKSEAIDLGKRIVLKEVLEVVDDFERSVEAAAQIEGPEALGKLREGVQLVHNKFVTVLNRLGVKPIEAVGQPFHEDEHEALMQQPAPEGTEPGVVLNEFQKGYRLGDRVLRHSRVVVSA